MTEMINLTKEEKERIERQMQAMAFLMKYSSDYLELVKNRLKERKLNNQMKAKFSKLRRSQEKRA